MAGYNISDKISIGFGKIRKKGRKEENDGKKRKERREVDKKERGK